jgi:hypothetical protein
MNSYDLALAKARAVPFGVTFKGTRARISYGAISAIGSILVSAFLYLAGYS